MLYDAMLISDIKKEFGQLLWQTILRTFHKCLFNKVQMASGQGSHWLIDSNNFIIYV